MTQARNDLQGQLTTAQSATTAANQALAQMTAARDAALTSGLYCTDFRCSAQATVCSEHIPPALQQQIAAGEQQLAKLEGLVQERAKEYRDLHSQLQCKERIEEAIAKAKQQLAEIQEQSAQAESVALRDIPVYPTDLHLWHPGTVASVASPAVQTQYSIALRKTVSHFIQGLESHVDRGNSESTTEAALRMLAATAWNKTSA